MLSQKFFSKLVKKSKAISPIIATILLIGLVVIAGAILFVIGTSFLSNTTEASLEISDTIVFSTTEESQLDSYVDTLRLQVSNPINEPVTIDLANSYIFNSSNGQRLYQWKSMSDNKLPTLSGKQSTTLEFRTAADQNIEELNYGEQIFVVFNVSKSTGNEGSVSVTSNDFTVTTANSLPIFDVVPINSYSQSGKTVYFEALPNQSITVNLSVAIWNRGNPSQSHTKSVYLNLENSTFFEPGDASQFKEITIPASNNIANKDTCEQGDPCVVVNFPLTRINLDENGYDAINASYGADLSLSGQEKIYNFELNITTPRLVSLVLPDSLVAKGTGTGRVSNSNLIYNGPFNSNNTLDLELILWNGDNESISANIYLSNLNLTAFALETTNITSVVIPNGTLPASLDSCSPGDPCTTVTWSITRLPLSQGGQDTGIIAGAYDISIKFIEFGTNLPVVLFINGPGSEANPYMYVQSVTWDDQYNSQQGTHDLTATVEIWDKNFNAIGGASVSVLWTFPDSSTVSLSDTTVGNGKVTFSQNNVATGLHKLTIIDVTKSGNIYDPSRNSISNNESTFTVQTLYVYVQSAEWTFTPGTGKKADVLELKITIFDQTGTGLNGVDVVIDWTDPSSTVTQYLGVTANDKGNKGVAIFTLSSPSTGTHSVQINNISYPMYTYASGNNVESFPITHVV